MALYRVNKKITNEDLAYYFAPDGPKHLDIRMMILALESCNMAFREEYDFNKNRLISLMNNIPKKNLSGAIGEAFGVGLANLMGGSIAKNLHESSGPDMLPCIPDTELWTKGKKKEYCPFDGFDMKGCFTNDKKLMKVKPSSHHDQTKSVLVVQWSSSTDTYGEINGLYYTRKLNRDDWKITRDPKDPESKLTSNARILASGIEKVRKGWVVIRDDVALPRDKKTIEFYSLEDFCLIDSKDI